LPTNNAISKEERRLDSRSNVILPGRFRRLLDRGKKKGETGAWVNSHISNVSKEGFCLSMPVGLEQDDLFEFEYHNKGRIVTGKARIAWLDTAKTRAGCNVVKDENGPPDARGERS
jgi:hypothetical protein